MSSFDNKMWLVIEILRTNKGYTQKELMKKDINELDKILSEISKHEEIRSNEISSSVHRILKGTAFTGEF